MGHTVLILWTQERVCKCRCNKNSWKSCTTDKDFYSDHDFIRQPHFPGKKFSVWILLWTVPEKIKMSIPCRVLLKCMTFQSSFSLSWGKMGYLNIFSIFWNNFCKVCATKLKQLKFSISKPEVTERHTWKQNSNPS